jgi:ribosomal protein L22
MAEERKPQEDKKEQQNVQTKMLAKQKTNLQNQTSKEISQDKSSEKFDQREGQNKKVQKTIVGKDKITESKQDDKKTDSQDSKKKKVKKEITHPKKDEVIAKGLNLHVSTKQCKYICRYIKNQSPDFAISLLEDVISMKRAVPFKGEIPHRKGNMMSGRYPIKACKLFIPILKSLKGNAILHGMEQENIRISIATASGASRPLRRGNVEAKRTNLILKARENNAPMKKKSSTDVKYENNDKEDLKSKGEQE